MIGVDLHSQTSDSVNYKVKQLPKPINTIYSEFNPVLDRNGYLYYSSYYPVNIDSMNPIFSSTFITEVFRVKVDERGYGNIEKLNKRINDRKNHNANISLNRTGTKMFFTRCEDYENEVGNCQIYFSEKKHGKWTKAKKLPKQINAKNTNNTQPFFHEGADFDVLYFVSDRKNGYGNLDIWYSISNNGNFSEPTNLGSNINTKADEMTPFYNRYKKQLYFSSVKEDGIGGLDIYKADGSLGSWKNIEIFKEPINSKANDIYFTTNRFGESYFSSNRKSSLHSEGMELCCGDLYFVLIESDVKRIVKDTIVIEELIMSNADKINKLLPISLYFHNDIPNPGSKKSTTKTNYKILLDEYALMLDEYIDNYSADLNKKDSIKAAEEIISFFDNEVFKGFKKLELLSNLLLEELEKGKVLNIKIKGYASPLNNTEYNKNLSSRRIESIINFLKKYKNGVFIKYINGNADNGGKLNIIKEPFGETKSAAYVSDNPNDKRNSVYSKSAALERKVEIIYFKEVKESENDILINIPEEIDFGIITKNSVKKLNLQISNNNDKTLILNNIKSNCNCINISEKQIEIEAGSSEIINFFVDYDNVKNAENIRISFTEEESEILYSFKIIYQLENKEEDED